MERVAAHLEETGTFLFGRDRAMLRKVIDQAAIGMAVTGMDGAIVYTNPAFDRDFFVDRSGSAPTLAGLFDPEDRQAAEALADILAGRLERHEGEHRCRACGHQLTWAMVAMSVLDSETTGEPIYVVVQVSSIDRRKHVERALAESESRWHFALEAARQGVWDHDARSGRMFYSPMWRTMRGIPQDEEIDDSQDAWLARVHPDDRERIRLDVSRQNRGDDGYDILEYRERHRDGHYIWILSRGKPVEWDENGKVARTVGTDTDITHLKEIEARLEYAATHDGLTGLANRTYFQRAIAAALSEPSASCLMFLDLDRFKPVNDVLGHSAGDAVLVEVGRMLRKIIRAADVAARIGGDEFAVLLRCRDLDDGRLVGEAIASAICAIPIQMAGRAHVLSASIGIVSLSPGMDADTALVRADAACYAAKNAGRSRIVVA